MHDNTRARIAAVVLLEVRISVMEWPARCPDINSIEYLWDELKRRIQGRDPASKTLGQLQNGSAFTIK